MYAWFLFLPTFLMVHNTIDFTRNGACDSYVNILNCVVTDFIEILEDHNDLRLVNKTAQLDDKIHKIGLHFEATNTFRLDYARTMMVGLVDSFVDALNSSQRLIPFRPDPCGPFTSDNVEIRVTFVDNSQFSYTGFGEVRRMIFEDGVISYYTVNNNPKCCADPYERLRDESLDFARRVSPPPLQFIPPKCRPL